MDLLDQIYEAAFLPEKWSETLDGISRATGSASGSVIVFAPGLTPRGRTATFAQAALDDHFESGAWKLSPRTARIGHLVDGFLCAEDLLSADDLERDPITIAQRALGVGWQCALSVPMPSGEMVVYTFERWLKDGRHPVEDVARLDGLRPHLARAGLLAARLRLERAQAAVATLEAIGLPAAVLSRTGIVRASNGLLDGLAPAIVPLAHGGLATMSTAANALLGQSIARLSAGAAAPIMSIPVPGQGETGPLVLHLVPFRRAARDLFSGGESLLLVSRVGRRATPNFAILMSLFDLTPAEARVSATLMSGRSVAEVAGDLSVTVATVRSHLKSIFSKTGTSRQSELLGLIGTLEGPGAGPAF